MHKSVTVIAAILSLSGLGACTSAYTGPIEVTRFVAASPEGLGEGQIAITFPEEMTNLRAQNAFRAALAAELSALGYAIADRPSASAQTASVRTSRDPIDRVTSGRRSPVSVGVGGSTGSYGSGVGVGLGINLGGNGARPEIVSELFVRIASVSGDTLWEGRAQLPTSMDSPYSNIEASANALTAALFRDFPGGNGETVQVTVEELERTP